MVVIKRARSDSRKDLLVALKTFIELLHSQDEDEAVEYLQGMYSEIEGLEAADMAGLSRCVEGLLEAFEGEHELIAYTHQRDTDQWTIAEQLSQSSSRVLSLVRRLRA